MEDKEYRKLATVLTGQREAIRSLKDRVNELANDHERDALRTEALDLLGDDEQEEPSEDGPAISRTPEPIGEWDDVVESHRSDLEARGVDTAALTIEGLLTTEERAVLDREWAALMEDVRFRLDAERTRHLNEACKRAVLDSIVRPFGLGQIVASYDKKGGSSLTVHNAERAAESEIDSFADPDRLREYKSTTGREYSPEVRDGYVGNRLQTKRDEHFAVSDSTSDAYTNQEISLSEADLDHVISVKEWHEDKKAHLYLKEDGMREAMHRNSNVVPTKSSINRSKKAEPMSEWREKRRPDGKTDEEYYGLDPDKASDVDRNARTQKGIDIGKSAVLYHGSAALKDAGKMGLQQAVGILLAELAVAIFDEFSDIIRNGFRGERLNNGFLDTACERIGRVWERVTTQWSNAVSAFKHGAFAGFLSSLLTIIINSFVTTAKRLVRIIREGVFSLWRAFWLLCNPPEDMSFEEAAHEATKLIAAGLAIAGGVALEELVQKAAEGTGWLAPFAPYVSAMVVGTVTGLATVLMAAWLDRIDLFGSVRDREQKATIADLEQRFLADLSKLDSDIRDVGPATD